MINKMSVYSICCDHEFHHFIILFNKDAYLSYKVGKNNIGAPKRHNDFCTLSNNIFFNIELFSFVLCRGSILFFFASFLVAFLSNPSSLQ